MDLSQSTLRQVAFTVGDVDQALAFYRDILGLRFLFRPAPTLAFLAIGDLRLMLSTPQGHGQVGVNSVLYFQVQDIEQHYADYVARGAQAERPPQEVAQMPDHALWIGFLRDPEGNLVGLLEEKR